MTSDATRILLISGSTRLGSTNTAALRTAQQVAPPGVDTVQQVAEPQSHAAQLVQPSGGTK